MSYRMFQHVIVIRQSYLLRLTCLDNKRIALENLYIHTNNGQWNKNAYEDDLLCTQSLISSTQTSEFYASQWGSILGLTLTFYKDKRTSFLNHSNYRTNFVISVILTVLTELFSLGLTHAMSNHNFTNNMVFNRQKCYLIRKFGTTSLHETHHCTHVLDALAVFDRVHI